jgi:phosphomannomutase
VRPPLKLAGSSVWRIDQTDGYKFLMKDGSWLGLRPSGTEPAVRLYAEASDAKKLAKLLDEGKKILAGKF